jgi:DNA-binding SARP family transcriptional activator/tetratricopeptide (TPR) repeat protein
MIECRLLGPVELRSGQRSIDTGQPRQRAVLAALAADAGRLVPVAELIDRIWGETPPDGARHALYSHIARVRRGLAQASNLTDLATNGQPRVLHRSGGYLLDIDPDQVDLHHFRHLIRRARTGQPDSQRVLLLRRARGLWRGQPLTGIPGPWAERMRQAWRLQYIDMLVIWTDAEIQTGNAATVIDTLVDPVAESPLVEPLAAAYMRALHAAGRDAEALDFYATTRRRLAEDLGVDPGAELQNLHQAILRGDPTPPSPTTPTAPAATAPTIPTAPVDLATPVPAQLPRDVHGFAGRGWELSQLHEVLTGHDDPPGTVVISALSGTAGVGKTSLAVHFAHQVAARFPDGQLYVNLHGFSTTSQARFPGEAIRMFLEALGVPPQNVPTSLDGQTALYRSRLAGKRALILLDNARDADQVRPLLPGSPTCLVLVTSRNQLAGLTVVEGARPLIVDLLTVDEARQLLAARLGRPRVAAEPDATAEIITSCARLPLALSIVAARAAARPTFPLAAFAAELHDAHSRLEALADEDPATDVRAMFSWSYDSLTPGAAHVFRLLGLHPGPDITAPAAASLAALPLRHTRTLLAELARATLILEHAPGRYTLHDLLRAYAAELAHTADTAEQRQDATRRFLDHYVNTAHVGARILDPQRAPIPLPPGPTSVTPEQLTDRSEAMSWFTAETHVVLNAIEHAVRSDLPVHAWQLAWAMAHFLDRRGFWNELAAAGRAAVAAAQRLGHPVAEAMAYRILALGAERLGHYDDATGYLHRALDLYDQAGNRAAQAPTHCQLAFVLGERQTYAEALQHAQLGLAKYRAAGGTSGEVGALADAGWWYSQLGDHERAMAHYQQVLVPLQQIGNQAGVAELWANIGYAHRHLGHHHDAIDSYQRALGMFREIGDRRFEATVLTAIGDLHDGMNDRYAARTAWQQALTILNQLDHPEADTVRIKLNHLDYDK